MPPVRPGGIGHELAGRRHLDRLDLPDFFDRRRVLGVQQVDDELDELSYFVDIVFDAL